MQEFESRRRVDLHNHTCKSLDLISHTPKTFWEMVAFKRLLGAAITDHNTTAGFEEAEQAYLETLARLGKQCPFLVYGAEVTCLVRERWSLEMVHLLVLGLDRNSKEARRIPVLNSVPEVAKWAHGVGALIGPSHPEVAPSHRTNSLTDVQIIEYLEKYPGLFDFMETTSPKIGKDQRLFRLALKLGLVPLGSSDSHSRDKIGLAGTVIPEEADVRSEADLINYFKTKPITETFLASDIPERLRGPRTIEFIVQEFIRERFLIADYNPH